MGLPLLPERVLCGLGIWEPWTLCIEEERETGIPPCCCCCCWPFCCPACKAPYVDLGLRSLDDGSRTGTDSSSLSLSILSSLTDPISSLETSVRERSKSESSSREMAASWLRETGHRTWLALALSELRLRLPLLDWWVSVWCCCWCCPPPPVPGATSFVVVPILRYLFCCCDHEGRK